MPPANARVFVCQRCGTSVRRRYGVTGCLVCLLQGGVEGEEPPDAALTPLPVDARVYQHYEVLLREDGTLHELGRGAMGVTYQALDVNLHVPVALKVIAPRFSADADARGRFLREARAAAQLRHPNVASVFHFGVTVPPEGDDPPEGTCFYAMEFIEGETLQERLHRSGPLAPEPALEIVLQVAQALVAAEKRGLVHRDLKPSNIMLVSDSGLLPAGEPWVKVIDFGLAVVMAGDGASLGGSRSFSGTPAFASPEQFQGGKVDARSDMFSLGVVLWYLLCGDVPFGEGSTSKAAREQPFDGVRPAAPLPAASLPPPVRSLLERLLAASPEDRFSSAETMRAAVQECLATLRSPASVGKELLPADLRAHEWYHLAKSAIGGAVPNQSRLEEAVRCLEESLAIDPSFVRAHALLAEVHALIHRKSFDRSPERAARVLAAADAALRLRPDSGEARRARGIYHYYIQRDYERAAEEFALALKALPRDAETLFCLGLTARRQNRWAEAVAHFQAAAEIDPYRPDYGTHWWKTLAGLRRYDEARAVLDRLIALHPEHVHLRVHRGYLAYSETADLRPLKETLAQLPADYDPNGSITFLRVGIARYECDADAADRYLAASPLSAFQGHVDGQLIPRESLHYLNLMLRGDMEQVRAIATGLLPGAIAHADAVPDEPGPRMIVGHLYSATGRRNEAVEAGQQALKLLPPEKDGVDGPTLAVQFAWVYLLLEEPGPAMDLLETYAPWPGGLSYGDLLLGNTYDLLRLDPRFQSLLATVRRPY